MKVAVCISGQLRNYRDCYSSLFGYLSNYECDYFINTWDEIGGTITATKNQYNNEKVDIQELKAVYQPKMINVDEVSLWNDMTILKNKYVGSEEQWIYYNGFLAQYYGWFKTLLMFKKYQTENNVQYDMVVRTRPDLEIFNSEPLNLAPDIFKVNPSRFICSEGTTVKNTGNIKGYWQVPSSPQSLQSQLAGLKSNIDDFTFSQDFIKQFSLEQYIEFADLEKLRNTIHNIDMSKINYDGVSDMINITTPENYEKYVSLVFLMFLIHYSDLLVGGGCAGKGKQPISIICGILGLQRHVQPNLSHYIRSNIGDL